MAIIVTIPPNQQQGGIRTPNGEPSGTWTLYPPTYPDAPVPVTCDLPCVGRVYDLPNASNHPLWACVVEKHAVYRAEGINGGGQSQWPPSAVFPPVFSEFWLPDMPPLYLPPESKPASYFWEIGVYHGEFPMFFNGTFHEPLVSTGGMYYRDSLGYALSPCESPPFCTEAEWDSKWQTIYRGWDSMGGQEGWVEYLYVNWGYAKIGQSLPQAVSLVPIYAGTMEMLGGLLGGSAGGGFGAVGLASMSFVLALLQGVSSSSAAAGGRVLKSSDGEESFEWMG